MPTQDDILQAFVQVVSSDGVCKLMVEKLGIKLNCSPAHIRLLCGETNDIIKLYNQWLTTQSMQGVDLTQKSISKRVKDLLKARFNILSSKYHFAQNLTKYLLNPVNTVLAGKLALSVADSIWTAIQPCSPDFSYYSKRAILTSFYLTCVLKFYKNPAQIDLFIESGIDNIVKIGTFKAKIKNFFI